MPIQTVNGKPLLVCVNPHAIDPSGTTMRNAGRCFLPYEPRTHGYWTTTLYLCDVCNYLELYMDDEGEAP